MTSRRRRLSAAALTTLVLGLIAPAMPAAADDAAPDPALTVTITGLTPSTLTPGQPVTMSGTVRNDNDFAWSDAQAYLVIPPSPFTSRDQVTAAIAGSNNYTGPRIVELNTIDDLGTIDPGDSESFSVTVPWEQLGVTASEGVYPVGVQILASRPDGERLNRARGRATTFLPLVDAGRPAVPGSILWPFFSPLRPGPDGLWANPGTLARAVSPDGRLRNLLDLVASTPVAAGTVLIDPALLDGLDDLAENRSIAEADRLDEQEITAVRAFADDLIALARRGGSTWVAGYAIPDQLALSQSGSHGTILRQVADAAAKASLAEHEITGRRATWIAETGIVPAVVEQLRRSGDEPLVVASSEVPAWDRRDGSVVTYPADAGPVPLLVTDDLDADLPGADSVVTLRQRLLTEGALATLQRGIDPDSRADAVAVVSPTFDPGSAWRAAGLETVWQVPWLRASTLDGLLLTDLVGVSARLSRPTVEPLDDATMRAIDELRATSATITSLGDPGVDDPIVRSIAGLLSVAGRDDPSGVAATARARTAALTSELGAVTIEGPPSFILSGSKGSVPLTISNASPRTITVGIRISSTNPALEVPDVEPVAIGPGQRDTIDVAVDVGRQSTSTLTAQLVTREGVDLGEPATFNVRSSSVGIILWAAMGFAGLLVVVALVRRFVLRRRAASTAGPVDG